MNVSLHVRQEKGVSIVDVSGRITLGEGASTLREGLRAMAKEGHKDILINLRDVSYIDSSGLGTLVSSFATLTNSGARVKLLNLSGRVKDLLLITKLHTVFEVFEDEAAAVASFPPVAAEA